MAMLLAATTSKQMVAELLQNGHFLLLSRPCHGLYSYQEGDLALPLSLVRFRCWNFQFAIAIAIECQPWFRARPPCFICVIF
jgi:hypothetical protein